MKPVRIFVEGETDRRLITDLIQYWFDYRIVKQVFLMQGWTTLQSGKQKGEDLRNLMRSHDGTNLLILDADQNFLKRKADVEAWKTKYQLDFELFLFPNNCDNGVVEDLLRQIINPDNAPIVECWDKYVDCLKTKEIKGRQQPLTIPARKSEIYCYLETLLGNTCEQKELIKDKNRNFLNKDHWNLDSGYLNRLKDFLQNNLF